MNAYSISTARRLSGEVTLPGDKSVSHRALVFSALAEGKSTIHGLSKALDPISTMVCLHTLGIRVETDGERLLAYGRGLRGFVPPGQDLDCGNSGTTMRLLCGILAGQSFTSTLMGDDSLSRRPMNRIIMPLTSMGASITGTASGTAPLKVTGTYPLRGMHYVAKTPSAQVKSAILLAGLYADGETSVVEPIPTRDHTERMLGLQRSATSEGMSVSIQGGRKVEPRDYVVPGDTSAAVFLIAAATLVPKSDITIQHVSVNPSRTKAFSCFSRLGAAIELIEPMVSAGEEMADVYVRASDVHGTLDISAEESASVIDEIPMLAVTAAVSNCGFSVRGASELRVKESDRINLLVSNLRGMKLDVEEFADGFAFGPKKDVLGTQIHTKGDHRIAMAFAIAGLVVPGMSIDDPMCVEVSFPGFWKTLDRLRTT